MGRPACGGRRIHGDVWHRRWRRRAGAGAATELMGATIPIDGGTLAYEAAGVGAPIVFIAGLGGHGSYWKAQVLALSSDFQTVTFDLRGVGASAGQPPYSIEQWAEDTLRLMDRLKIG